MVLYHKLRGTMNERSAVKLINPNFRHDLKAEIIRAGYRTMKDFSRDSGINQATMSRYVSGWQTPGPKHQKILASTLGITIRELSLIL